MKKASTLLFALLFASATAAYAETQPTSTGSASVEKNLTSETGASAKSDGHADKGLTKAQERIMHQEQHKVQERTKTQEHTMAQHHLGKPEKVEKADKASKPDHPSRPERVGK